LFAEAVVESATEPPKKSKTEQRPSKRRENILILLFVTAAVLGGDFFKLLPESLRSEYTPFALSLLCGLLTSLGVLLSYWWALRTPEKAGTYFAALCAFTFFFMLSAVKGLFVLAVSGQAVAEFSDAQSFSCSVEAQLCQRFLLSKESEKTRAAEMFFSRSGLNLLVPGDPTKVLLAPTKQAESDRAKQLKAEAQFAEVKSSIARRNELSLWLFYLHIGIAALVLSIGGALLRFKSPRPPTCDRLP
jgi:hypothetical protein